MSSTPLAPGGRILVDGPADNPDLKLGTPDGRWVRLHGRNPRAEAAAWLEDGLRAQPAPAVIVVIGAAAGYVLDEIDTRLPRCPVIVLEPDPRLRDIAQRRLDATANGNGTGNGGSDGDGDGRLSVGRVQWFTGPDYAGASDIWRTIDKHPGEVLTLEHPVFAREYPDDVARARAIVKRATFDAAANADARRRFAGPYLLNTLENLPTIASSGDVAALRGLLAGHAALLVAAGPSLDETIADVRRLRDRAVIIAVDTALRPLLAAGIAPDVVVAVDPAEINARHLRDLPDTGACWLVAEGSLHASTFPAFVGRTFTFKVSQHDPWPWLQAHGLDRGTLRAWGSVVTSTFDLGLLLGCDPLVFVGSDLAFTGGRPYCRGTTYEEEWAELVGKGMSLPAVWAASLATRTLLDVDDVRGRPVKTSPHLVAFRDWLVEQAAACGRRVINATGGGILAGPAIEAMSLDRAFAAIAPVTPALIADRLAHAHHESADAGRARSIAGLREAGAKRDELTNIIDAWSRRVFLSPDHTANLQRTLATRLIDLDAATDRLRRERDGEHTRRQTRETRRSQGVRLWAPERTSVLEAIRHGGACPESLRRPPDADAATRALAEAADALAAGAVRDALDWLAEATCVSPVRSMPPLVGLPSTDASVLNLATPIAAPPPASDADNASAQSPSPALAPVPLPSRLDALRLWTATAAYCHASASAADAPLPPFIRLADALSRAAATRPDAHVINGPWSDRIVRGTVRLGEPAHVVLDNVAVDASLLAEGLLGVAVERVASADAPSTAPSASASSESASSPSASSAAADALTLTATATIAPLRGELRIDPPTLSPSPRGGFDWRWPFTSRARWLEPRNLTAAGLGRSYYAAQLPDGRALIVKVGVGQSTAIDSRGRETPRDTFPASIAGELPWGPDGGAVAWSGHHLFVRRHAGAPVETYPTPAVANVAHVEEDGRLLWPTLNGGLWQWDPDPSIGFRFLAAVPPVNGIRTTPEGYELDPIVMTSGPAFPRVRLDYAWQWIPGRADAVRVAGRPEGQSWSSAAYDGVEATAYNFSDVVRVCLRRDVDGGRTFDLYVPQPLGVAWAGRSLLVTTSAATVLLFEDLITRLEAAPDARGR